MAEEPTTQGPISGSKVPTTPASKQEIQKAFPPLAFQEIFAIEEEGPTVPISVRVPPTLNKLIEELILHPNLPWANKSDSMRNAAFIVAKGLVNLLKTRGAQVNKLVPFLTKLEALRLEAERHLALQRTIKAMGDVNDSVGIYIQENAWGDLLVLLDSYAAVLNEMPSGFYSQQAMVKFFMQGNVNVAEAIRSFRLKEEAKWQSYLQGLTMRQGTS